MQVSIYKQENQTADSINNFMDLYYGLRMHFFASDLLYKGLSPKQISSAVAKAMDVAKSSKMNLREHFRPVFSSIADEVISDCKLSRLGYGLVLMNAETKLSIVGKWQLKVLESFLGGGYTH
ncbi:hypothetical protein D9V96_014325 [Zobellia laminariae]|uniref:Uncharacterized protein n=1 Tax=Zobellia barbeyronii TaxID=2748009 RepID=A0ABS5WDY7_9FLAO|nr:hypothetical protein [Zobellia barbeyronii]MBT2161616.1 hypothetical protein [Zobellia barbeyronii]MUH41428.1 hypothetical protein [Zobellia laminariae]